MADEKPDVRSMADLTAVFDRHLLLADRNIVKVIAANMIANQFRGYPNWLFVIAPSSGGKSEVIQAFNGVKLHGRQMVFPISDITTNAFASGQKKTGKETSLLHQIPPGGILSFKDFTSMVSKAKEQRAEIFKQLREIFDGNYVKRTGTGENVEWVGKVGALAGATEVIYEYQAEFAAMGDRFIMYSMAQPDRKEVLRFVMDDARINSDKSAMQTELRDAVSSYVGHIVTGMREEDVTLDPILKEDLSAVADFCTRVRSGVVVDERRPNIINYVPTPEMPVRVVHQLLNLAKAFIVMRKTEPGGGHATDALTDEEAGLLYKIAFDSIPIKRRVALKALARHAGGVTTKGLAVAVNYQTAVVNAWLAQLNALGICSREIRGGNQGDTWNLRKEYRDVMVKFEKVEVTNEALQAPDDGTEDEELQRDRSLESKATEEAPLDQADQGYWESLGGDN